MVVDRQTVIKNSISSLGKPSKNEPDNYKKVFECVCRQTKSLIKELRSYRGRISSCEEGKGNIKVLQYLPYDVKAIGQNIKWRGGEGGLKIWWKNQDF